MMMSMREKKMTILSLKSEKTTCIFCGHKFEVKFSTSEDDLISFLLGWQKYRKVRDEIVRHKLECEGRYYLEKEAK